MQSSPELRKRLKHEAAQKRNEKRKPLPKEELTIDKVIESKRRRTQTARFGQEPESNSGQNTKASSPEDDKAHESSGHDSWSSSPEKQDMSSEYDYSYDGDSDMVNQRGGSKIKNRRRHKKHRKDKRRSPSPNKKRRFNDFESSGEKDGSSQVE